MQELDIIEGVFKIIIFQSSNQYKVARFCMNNQKDKLVTVVGYFGELLEDTQYRLKGEYKEHPRYGMQFNVVSYERILPNDDVSLIHYFSSNVFHGIGKKTAEKIVNYFGSECIHILKEDPTKINEVEGLSKKQINSIMQGILEDDNSDDIIIFLTQFGISLKEIMKIKEMYGDDSLNIIKNNPYQLMDDIDGIGFKTADKIAMQLGFELEDENRMKAAICSLIMNMSMASGNTYLAYEDVKNEWIRRLQINNVDVFDSYIDELCMQRKIFVDDHHDIYEITQYDAEKGIAEFLSYFPYVEEEKIKMDVVKSKLAQIEELFNITYEDKQKEAILSFFEHSFSIITGGPGTGKTTIVRGILALYKDLYPNHTISVCAPTGRASKRLGELAQVESSTIHRLLKWDLENNCFGINEEEPLQCDLLVIDEFSMVDSYLFYNILRAGAYVKKILIIGDEDQLPSVGPGFVLKDLISSDCFNVSRLTKIYRQKEGSDVITLANEIKHGTCDILENGSEVKLFNVVNYHVKDMIVNIVKNAFDKGYTIDDIQVLAPMYSGVAGIDALNVALQEVCNPRDEMKKEIKVGYKTYREGDKVLQLKNLPDDDVYNGDIGKIIEIVYEKEDYDHQNRIIAEYDNGIIEYTKENFNMLTHAYCISIHKSQGSEYPIVIMPILKEHQYMLQRRLIYTGITRAKKSLVLLGDENILIQGINREERYPRKTKLKDKIKQKFEQLEFDENAFE